MPTITIDNQTRTVSEGQTILEIANQAGIAIPTLCYRSDCRPETSCLVCQVRLIDPNRPGSYKTVPSCATLAVDGMVIDASSVEVIQARKAALELLLSDHRGDCFGPCTTICPTGLDIPALVRAFAKGRQDWAEKTIFRSMAFPSVLGRLCGHPCENGCRRKALDQSIPIQSIHRTVSDEQLFSSDSKRFRSVQTAVASDPLALDSTLADKSVAVVGAGIAGLTAAFLLARQGARVVVFDRQGEAGGRLRTEFAEKLSSFGPSAGSVLDAEIERVWAQSVDWRPNVLIDQPETLSELSCHFSAVLWAAGAESFPVLRAILADSGLNALSLDAPSTSRWKNLFWVSDNLFIAGDAKRGKKSPPVLNAGDGRWSALAIARFLQGEDLFQYEQTGLRPWGTRSYAQTKDELQSLAAAAAKDALSETLEPNRQEDCRPEVGDLGIEEKRLDSLRQAAKNCLHCDCRAVDDCRLRIWSDRYQAAPERWGRSDRPLTVSTSDISSECEAIREPSKCINCGLCVQIANQAVREESALQAEWDETSAVHSGLAFRGRGFPVQVQVPFNDPLPESMSQDTAQRCFDACPTAAFSIRFR